MSLLLNSLKLCRGIIQNRRLISTSAPLRIIFLDVANKMFLFHIEYGKNAEVHYREHNKYVNVIDLFHTYVPKEYRGKGVAYLMAEEVFELLIEEKVKVTLSCPFLVGFINDYPDYKKVLYVPPV